MEARAKNRRANAHCRWTVVAVALCSLSQLAGCSWNNQAVSDSEAGRGTEVTGGASVSEVRSQAALAARQMIGTPYRYGGTTPAGFDCSGLVLYAYQRAGLSVPRTSGEQLQATTPVRLDEAQPGDLLFFRQRRKVSHVGIYLGDRQFVHAPSTGKQVAIARLDEPYYHDHFVRAGRF
jgi:cell wall-associated NlpC family hydrolase